MEITYTLRVRGQGNDPSLSQMDDSLSMEIEGIRIQLGCSEGTRQISEVKLIIAGAELQRNEERGTIITSYPDIEARAFAAASYVADVLCIETGMDGIIPSDVFSISPAIRAETPDEQAVMENARREVASSLSIRWTVRSLLSPEAWHQWSKVGSNLQVREAAASYASGLRASNPFLAYEQFFKVIEHFFPGLHGSTMDQALTRHLSTCDEPITLELAKALREVRIRLVHAKPRSAGPHLSPSRQNDIRTVDMYLPEIRKVALQLLRKPAK